MTAQDLFHATSLVPKPPDPPSTNQVDARFLKAVLEHGQTLTPSNATSSSAAVKTTQKPTFASLVAKPKPRAQLPDVPLPARQYGLKDGVPAISFTPAEHQAMANRFRHTIIAKFQIGRPNSTIVRDFIIKNWRLQGQFSISSKWDDRHIVIILDSEEDVNAALTCPYRKVQHAFFRLFRWSAGYDPQKESTRITKWIRLPELPMEYFTRSGIKAIVSSFAYFLDLDDRTYELNSLHVARACVEIDIAQPIPSQVWIQVGDQGFYQDIIIEGAIAYCNRCKIHGHDFSVCKKAAKAIARNTKNQAEEGEPKNQSTKQKMRNGKL